MKKLEWQSLGLSEITVELIEKAGFGNPTPIQALAIPPALAGEDLIASAQTGTGKTASFVLPLIEKIAGREGTYGLILAPTREITQQIQQTLEIFGTPRGIRSVALIGGVHMRLDIQALNLYPQIIVATPGRLCDHLDRGSLWLDYIEIVILDEADQMLDLGFSAQVSRIMQEVPKKRQTLLFSATISEEVNRLSRKILFQPRTLNIQKTQSLLGSVKQKIIWMHEEDKMQELRRLIQSELKSIIVFTRSKEGATRVWRSLHSARIYDATYIHSDRPQSQREQALVDFKEGKFRILIATDVVGRGIHIDEVAHVINFDLPFDPENYIHRIGRTGRAGLKGESTTFATPRDRLMIQRIEKLIGKPIFGESLKVSVPSQRKIIKKH